MKKAEAMVLACESGLPLPNEDGEVAFLETLCGRFAGGEHIYDVCEGLGYPWMTVRAWLEQSEKRTEAFVLAKRCYADRLVGESVKAAQGATKEDVSVATLQAGHYLKVAGKLSPDDWGEQRGGGGKGFSGGITIVIGDVKIPERFDATDATVVVDQSNIVGDA